MQTSVTIPARHPGRNADRSGGAPRRSDALLAVAWVGVVLVFWFGLFVPSMQPGVFRPEAADLYGYFVPKLVYASQELAHGRLPLWNPWEYGGLPFLGAAQTAVLYPLFPAVFALLRPATALHVFMVAHYLLLGAGAFAMLRAFRLGVPGAIFGTLCLVFQPTLMSSHYNPIRIAAFTWVPWMVAALVWTVERRSLAAALALAVAATLQVLAGYPEYAVDTAMILAVLLPAAALRVRDARGVGLVGGAALAAALVSAPQLVAIAEMFRTSVRAAGAVPFLAGQGFDLAAYGSGLGAWVSSISTFGYLPALGWLLVFVGVVAPRRPYRWALLAVWILASVAYSEPLRTIPPFRFFRSFLPWSTLLYVPLAAFAGAGFDRAAAAVAGDRPARREVAVALVGLAVALPLLSLRSLAGLAVTVAILAAGRVARVAPRTAVGAALVATLATIWTWIPPTLPQTLRHRYARGETPFPSLDDAFARVAELRAACGDDVRGRVLAPVETLLGLPVLGRVPAVQGYPEPLAPARTSRLLAAAGLAPETLLPLDWDRVARSAGVLRLLDVRCILLPPGHEDGLARLGFAPGGRLADGRTAWVQPATGVARVVSAVRHAPNAEDGLAAVLDPAVDLASEAVVESPGTSACGTGETCDPAPVDARLATVGESPGRLVFRVESATDAHLVVAVSHAPGWRAAVDGRPVAIVPADYAFMAVPLEAGRHVVELYYRPRGFTAAVVLALVGVALMATAGIRVVVRRQSVAGGSAASSAA